MEGQGAHHCRTEADRPISCAGYIGPTAPPGANRCRGPVRVPLRCHSEGVGPQRTVRATTCVGVRGRPDDV